MGTVANIAYNDGLAPLPVTYTYTYTGADQTITIPAVYDTVTVECWGAGGATKGQGAVTIYITGTSGGGGYTKATFSTGSTTSLINSGFTTMKAIVGQGGISLDGGVAAPATYGGGGGEPAPGGSWGSASGGGRSAVQMQISGSFTEIITAGGGGAGGASYTGARLNVGTGGAGGGLIGGDAYRFDNEGGYGGTQTAGGAGGTNVVVGSAPTPGTKFTGGTGNDYAAGGGGGYYGGGGGGISGNTYNPGGGGGGSSYVLPSGTSNIIVSNTTYTQAPTILYNSQNIATGDVANNAGLPAIYQNTIGNGKVGTMTLLKGSSGQNGLVIVRFSKEYF